MVTPRPDETTDEARLLGHGEELARAVDEAVAGWIEASVARVARARLGSVPDEVAEAARRAGESARREVADALTALLSSDVDEQRTTPLTIVRCAGAHATGVLRGAGIAPAERDRFSEERFPDDEYGIGPAHLGELSPACHEAGIAWGAAKAHVHMARHRSRR